MSDAADLAIHRHVFLPATAPHLPPLLLLHRTGGNEEELIPLARRILPGAALLAICGNVLEDGKPRFFRRIGKGDFDLADLQVRMGELEVFIEAAARHYQIPQPVALGHSNGANIIWPLVLAGTKVLSGAILLRPMLAFRPHEIADVAGLPVLVVTGDADQVVVPELAGDLPELCRAAGALVAHHVIKGGHDLTQDDLAVSSTWLKRQFRTARRRRA
jgi:phospholipase/carboxylesterase